jgi:hypothetical protein
MLCHHNGVQCLKGMGCAIFVTRRQTGRRPKASREKAKKEPRALNPRVRSKRLDSTAPVPKPTSSTYYLRSSKMRGRKEPLPRAVPNNKPTTLDWDSKDSKSETVEITSPSSRSSTSEATLSRSPGFSELLIARPDDESANRPITIRFWSQLQGPSAARI